MIDNLFDDQPIDSNSLSEAQRKDLKDKEKKKGKYQMPILVDVDAVNLHYRQLSRQPLTAWEIEDARLRRTARHPPTVYGPDDY